MKEKMIDDLEIWTTPTVSRRTLVMALLVDYSLCLAAGFTLGYFVAVFTH